MEKRDSWKIDGPFLGLLVLAFIPVLFVLPATASGDSCTITMLSIPDGAAVSIDGTLVGAAPQHALELSCGDHTIAVRANGYADFLENVTLERGNTRVVIANLRRLADRGTVLIKSYPPGGEVYIDGALRGTTPLQVDALSPGPHAILIRKTNFEDYRDTVTAGAGITSEYEEWLVPLPQTGFLGIVSTPDGGKAYLDDTFLGTTPTRLAQVNAGNHTLRIQKQGYRNYTKELAVQGGTTKLVQAELEKIPEDGTLFVDSSPQGVALYLNGTYKTVTPVTFEHFPTGDYTLEFRKPGYTGQNITFTLKGGETGEIYSVLRNDPGDTSRPRIWKYSPDGIVYGNTTGPGNDPGTVIEKNYSWYAGGQARSVTLHIPKSLYTFYRNKTHPTNAASLKEYTLSDEDRFYLHDLIGQLKDSGGDRSLAARNDYRNVVAFVQGIPYALHTNQSTGKTTNGTDDFWKYPVETLADGNGDCIDDAILAGALLKEMNYDVAIVLLPQVRGQDAGHAVVGISCSNCNGYYYSLNGTRYYYLDLTGPGLSLGAMSYLGQNDIYANTPAQVVVL